MIFFSYHVFPRRYQAKQRLTVEPVNATQTEKTDESSVDPPNPVSTASPSSSSIIPSASSLEDPVRRRQLLLEATQRRLDSAAAAAQINDGNQG